MYLVTRCKLMTQHPVVDAKQCVLVISSAIGAGKEEAHTRDNDSLEVDLGATPRCNAHGRPFARYLTVNDST